MPTAEFEESEFRGALYNQLERGSHLVWEPGQVFEKHIGIDKASHVVRQSFWDLHGLSYPPTGVSLNALPKTYLPKAKRRTLPEFRLNLFLQAKRPHFGTRVPVPVQKKGVGPRFWKFAVTKHQQRALEKLSSATGNDAIVCYACPAFHTFTDLFTYTQNRRIVENSTFPWATDLSGHSNFYFDRPNAGGVANPDFEPTQERDLFRQIDEVVNAASDTQNNSSRSLADLANALQTTANELPATTRLAIEHRTAFFFDQLRSLILSSNIDSPPESMLEDLNHYARARMISAALRLHWFVLGGR